MRRLKCAVLGGLLLPCIASAEIMPLDETQMGGVTGQAGITIDFAMDMEIGEIRYQDQGSIAARNVRLGGANKATYFGEDWGSATYSGDRLDHASVKIDVLADGDLVFFMRPEAGFGQAVDFKLTMDEVVLMTEGGVDGTHLVDQFSMTGLALDLRAKVDNQTSVLSIETTFAIDDLDADLSFVGVGIRDMKVAGLTYFESLRDYGSIGIGDIGASLKVDVYAKTTPYVTNGLAIDIKEFTADVALPEIYLGSAPSIGEVNLNDVDIAAELVVYGH